MRDHGGGEGPRGFNLLPAPVPDWDAPKLGRARRERMALSAAPDPQSGQRKQAWRTRFGQAADHLKAAAARNAHGRGWASLCRAPPASPPV